jgi:hypothetical protein
MSHHSSLTAPMLKCLTFWFLLIASLRIAEASSTLPMNTPDLVESSAAVFRGAVVRFHAYKDANGLIYTRTSLRVEETFKGTFPSTVEVVHRGGVVGRDEEYFGLSPKLVRGQKYLLFLIRGADGKLQCTQGAASAVPLAGVGAEFAEPGQTMLNSLRSMTAQGPLPGADVTDQGSGGFETEATTGMLQGVNSRFLQPDRGESIPYLIDADNLPAGMTLTQATNAVREAFDAWAAVTSLKFKFEGIQSFGQAADTIALNDEKLRIQLHDNYNRITNVNVLGIGGRASQSNSVGTTGWNLGGNVAGNEFRKSAYGYVVLEATNITMQNLSTFTEVLCHEIGHALNMAHSSEVVTSDPVLLNSIMYFQVHGDGRGATLGSYDPPVIQQVYPTNNTPPFTFNRVFDVTSGPSAPNIPGINEIELRGYDLQNTALTLATNGQTGGNGSMSLDGMKLKFTPNFVNSTTRSDPDTSSGTSFKHIIFLRFSDGTNASPFVHARVVSLKVETVGQDGLPDYWSMNYFGHADPQAGDLSRATDDADGDGLNNLKDPPTCSTGHA